MDRKNDNKEHLDKLAVLLAQVILETIDQTLQLEGIKLSDDIDFFLAVVDNKTTACTSTFDPTESRALLKSLLRQMERQQIETNEAHEVH